MSPAPAPPSARSRADNTDAQGNVTQFTYDGSGNRTGSTDALQNTTSFTYDAMNRPTVVTLADGSTNQTAYDIRGRRISSTDGNGKVTTYAYDDADHLTSVTDAAGNVTQYAYDAENSLVSITDALQRQTAFAYDNQGRVTQTTFPSGLKETYTYDAVGKLLSKTDRNNNTITYSYDALSRLVRKQYPDGTGVNYTYDLANRLTQVADSTGTYGFNYDNLGRLKGTTTQYSFLTGTTFTNAYGYDAVSNRTSFTAPDGSTETYSYDTLGRMTTLADSGAGQFTFAYDALSRRTGLTRPNGISTGYNFDSLSRLLSVLHHAGNTTVDGANYTYDNAGNRTAKTNSLNNITEQYAYDTLYQLTQVTQGTTTTESYTYDAVGNRLSSLGMSTYSYNTSNELTATPADTFTYDNNGNTLSKTNSTGIRNYTWDFENRLASVVLPGSGGAVTFKYDAFGRRIQKSSSSGTINYLYDGSNSVEEVDQSGNVLARYAQGAGIDEPLAEARSGAVGYYEQDGLGTVTSLSNSTTSPANTYVYDAFGNTTASTGTLVNSFQYTGRDYDPETGLHYYRARYYDSAIGHFLSEDPIRFHGGMNFYAYVHNNPTNSIDPLGLATLHYWASNSDRWGHVSLTLDDGTHISFYPSYFSLLHPNSDPVYHDFLGQDNIDEHSKPDIEIHLDNLDESKIKAWWDNYKKTNPKFRGLSNNCSTVISKALDAGGAEQHVPKFGIVPIWSPDIVLDLGRQLKLAGSGIYIEP